MRSEVREATRTQHEDLERRLALTPGDITLDSYRRFLEMTASVVIPLEGPIAERLGDLFRVEGANRAQRLTSDLAALGLSTRATPPATLPDVSSHADAFGIAYVLQGSLLGGVGIAQILGKHLARAETSMSYLTLYGPHLGHAWQRFTAGLDTFGATAAPDERARTIAAAVATFAAFDSALTALS